MAVYKVPQDVEAEDKLLGPFSFRQFIYLLVVAIACGLAWALSTLFFALVLIPLPIILLFGALALPLRKDQPMETYLIAMIRFYTKPRARLWMPDGNVGMVEVMAPRIVEEVRTKGLSEDAARSQLDNLANLMDSRGWSAKGVMSNPSAAAIAQPDPVMTISDDTGPDVLDDDASVSRSFDTLLAREDAQRRQEAVERMRQQASEPPTAPQVQIGDRQPMTAQVVPAQPPTNAWDKVSRFAHPDTDTVTATPDHVDFNPYPNMHQRVIGGEPPDDSQAASSQAPATNPTPQPSPISVSLANNPTISIASMANEAHRLEKKLEDQDEVVISLR